MASGSSTTLGTGMGHKKTYDGTKHRFELVCPPTPDFSLVVQLELIYDRRISPLCALSASQLVTGFLIRYSTWTGPSFARSKL